MYKRIAAYIFILLANTIVLAHAVVPHHHHHNVICFESSHCNDEISHPNNNSSSSDHQHDNKNNPDTCFLIDYFVNQSEQINKICSCLHLSNDHSHDQLFTLGFSLPDISAPITAILVRPVSQVILPLLFHQSSQALRAPPVA